MATIGLARLASVAVSGQSNAAVLVVEPALPSLLFFLISKLPQSG